MIIKRLILSMIVAALSLFVLQCGETKAKPELPFDVLGISVGMGKAEVQKRLEEIAVFERDERKNQQVWKMKDASRYSDVAVGFDKENKIRYVTAFVNKDALKDKIKFSDVGDISAAKQEIVQQHHRYIWEVPADGGKPAYAVNVYGDNPEFVTIYSLARIYQPDELNESEEDEE